MLSKKKIVFGASLAIFASIAGGMRASASIITGEGGDGGNGSCTSSGVFSANYPDKNFVCHVGGSNIYSVPAWVHYTFTDNFKNEVKNGTQKAKDILKKFYLAPATDPTGSTQYFGNEKDDLEECIKGGGDGFYRLGTLEAKRGIHYGTGVGKESEYSTSTTSAKNAVIFTSLKNNKEASLTGDAQPIRFGVDGKMSMNAYIAGDSTNYAWRTATEDVWKKRMGKYYTQDDAWGQYIYWGSVSADNLLAKAEGRAAFSPAYPKDGEAYKAYKAGGGEKDADYFYGNINSFCAIPEEINANFNGLTSLHYGGTHSDKANGPTVNLGAETSSFKVSRTYTVENTSGNDIPPYFGVGKGHDSWEITNSPYDGRKGKKGGTSVDYVNWHYATGPKESFTKDSSSIDILPGETIKYCMDLTYSLSAVRKSGETNYSSDNGYHESCMTFKRPMLVSNISGSIQARVSEIKNGASNIKKDHIVSYSYRGDNDVELVSVSTEKSEIDMGAYACRYASADPAIPNYLNAYGAQFSNGFEIDTAKAYSSTNHAHLVVNNNPAYGLRLRLPKNGAICGTNSQWQNQTSNTFKVDGLKPGQKSDVYSLTYRYPRQVDNQSIPTKVEPTHNDVRLNVQVQREGYSCGNGFNTQYGQFGEGFGANMAYVTTNIGNKIGGLLSVDSTNNYAGGGNTSETEHFIAPGTNFAFTYGVCAGGAFTAKYSSGANEISGGDAIAKENTEFKWSAGPERKSSLVSDSRLTSYMFAFSPNDWGAIDTRNAINSGNRVYSFDSQNIDFGNDAANAFLKDPGGSSSGFNAGATNNKKWYAAGAYAGNIASPYLKKNIRVAHNGSLADDSDLTASAIYSSASGNRGYTAKSLSDKSSDTWIVGRDSDVGQTISQTISWKQLTIDDGSIKESGSTKSATAKVSVPYNYYIMPTFQNKLSDKYIVGSSIDVSINSNVMPRVNKAIEGYKAGESYSTETKPTRVALSWFTIQNTETPVNIMKAVSHGMVLTKNNGYNFNPCAVATGNTYGNNCHTYENDAAVLEEGQGITIQKHDSNMHDGKFTIPNAPIGTKVCFVVSAYPFDSHGYVNYNADGTIKRKSSGAPDMDITGSNAKSLQAHALSDGVDGSDSWYVSAPSCTTIGKKPSFSIEGGNAFVKGDVRASVMTLTGDGGSKKTRYGSWVESMLISGGTLRGIATGAALGYGTDGHNNHIGVNEASVKSGMTIAATMDSTGEKRLKNTQTVSNIGYPGNVDSPTVDRILEYIKQLTNNLKARFADTVKKSSSYTNINFKGCTNNDGSYVPVNGDGSYRCREKDGLAYLNLKSNSNGNKEINSLSIEWPAYTETNRANRTLVIDAGEDAVYINGNIEAYKGNMQYLAEIPHVLIFAKNVYISSDVTRIDAWIFAEKIDGDNKSGRVVTCADNSANGNKGGAADYSWLGLIRREQRNDTISDTAAVCTKQLVVNGLVSADNLILNRTYGAGTTSTSDEMEQSKYVQRAEIFNLTPLDYYWAYNESILEGTLTTSVEHELPTRL